MQMSKVLSRNLITIPREMAKALNIHPGDYLKIERQGNALRLAPVLIEEQWSEEEMTALRETHRMEKHRSHRIHSKTEIRRELK